jgi:hypothetical protein
MATRLKTKKTYLKALQPKKELTKIPPEKVKVPTPTPLEEKKIPPLRAIYQPDGSVIYKQGTEGGNIKNIILTKEEEAALQGKGGKLTPNVEEVRNAQMAAAAIQKKEKKEGTQAKIIEMAGGIKEPELPEIPTEEELAAPELEGSRLEEFGKAWLGKYPQKEEVEPGVRGYFNEAAKGIINRASVASTSIRRLISSVGQKTGVASAQETERVLTENKQALGDAIKLLENSRDPATEQAVITELERTIASLKEFAQEAHTNNHLDPNWMTSGGIDIEAGINTDRKNLESTVGVLKESMMARQRAALLAGTGYE